MLHITKDNFEAEVIGSDKPVLIDFGAPWCIPCKKVAQVIGEIEGEQSGVKFCKIDIEESPELASKLGVLSIPYLILFKDGKPVAKQAGGNKKSILKMLG